MASPVPSASSFHTPSNNNLPKHPVTPLADPAAAKLRAQRKQERAAAKRRPDNVVDAGTAVNFDDAPQTETNESVHTDLCSDDLKIALQYYARHNKQFLMDVFVKHFTETELEYFFQELHSFENERVKMEQAFTSHGRWSFDDLNQRFIGIPATNMKKYPSETFQTDPYRYKLLGEELPENVTSESTEKKSQPATPHLYGKWHKSKTSAVKEYIRVGDIRLYERLLENLTADCTATHLFNKKKVKLKPKAKHTPCVLKEDPASRESILVHPGTKHVFTPPSTRKIPRDVETVEVCDPAAPAAYFPDHSDLAVLYEYVENYRELMWADEAAVYVLDPMSKCLTKVINESPVKVVNKDARHPTMAALQSDRCIVSNHVDHDLRYSILTGDDTTSDVKHIMAIPFHDTNGAGRGVIEFKRTLRFPAPFTEAALHSATEDLHHFAYMLYKAADYRRELNVYRVLGKRFHELFVKPNNLDHIIYRFMILVKSLLNPARVHLFRVDTDRKYAVASAYDTGRMSHYGYHFDYSRTIRIPVCATFVFDLVQLRQPMNVKHPSDASIAGQGLEAYLPGPPITSLLAMPFTDDLENKLCEFILLINDPGNNGFSASDEHILSALLTFFVSAIGTLSYRYRVQATSRPLRAEGDLFCRLSIESLDDVEDLLRMCQGNFSVPSEFYTHDFYCKAYLEDNLKLPYLFMMMVEDLFGNDAFDQRKLAAFTLAVREGYRSVRYHGWHHGISVAHTMFVMLRDNRDHFTDLERKSLMVATLCHDLDHLGFNNAFAKKFISPLEKLYPASQMENHHIRETFRILSIINCDIFHNWSEADKSAVAVMIKEAILATDLALYFAGKRSFEAMLDNDEIRLDNGDHRRRLMNILMNACDLTASTKPWGYQAECTRDLYDEFYTQGDIEKRYGEPPIPMLDRDNEGNLAREQVGFLRYVCMPLYALVSRILPSTQCLVDSCVVNMMHWEQEVIKAEEAQTEKLAVGTHERANEVEHLDPSDVVMGGKAKRPRTPRSGASDVDTRDKHGRGLAKSPKPKAGKVDDKATRAKANAM
ncbi:cAMP and cAMP-inhibited cGMP 3',5'-cyclic phosphodiesterase 10A-like [Paramacrobiotus metropolitanus]|uniref:cAMP and cAMP-inhibited cGMP 3',5'-cyclic phosphodiesterase 10A-like n=1 Tax=Paramacrobiotus metropolitanus TaxID=2943436 RepID=UPI0024458683|nr:cAMP and cAMP-inhibited cGMP 3',5'-cyclic phosphodiesterase 10A-like [Paramacrobiotus metropolitanus]XP_055341605.1 cAMP and cAMP-inhibited cGMP 3',5'-cyclic phosphodiesterase 10A-like [Paramacrobiotus metropolitanus]XP_055341606.1 cAMP and cAMP-inhibited cGMP 3',5'-cyclic phosphodiesterase 10A-like [Paramacrobiotus metropolitanus]XP_055341607.1 cAMP and cAMP-inhibited cGMP 3',5'-cyclic phosphodiesterase 10A-like [Paramacrobiotus metropolitanus]XP_055341608.1 cAMP and cAMP-inhibited cGMP 3',